MTEKRQHSLPSDFEFWALTETRPGIEPMPSVHKPCTYATELFSLYGLYLGNVKITWLQFVVPWWTYQGIDAQQGRAVESIDILQNWPGWTGRWRRRYCQVVLWAAGYEPGTLQNERESTLRPQHQIHSAFFLLPLKSLILSLNSRLKKSHPRQADFVEIVYVRRAIPNVWSGTLSQAIISKLTV